MPSRAAAVAVDLDVGLDAVLLPGRCRRPSARAAASARRPACATSRAGRRGCRSSACTGTSSCSRGRPRARPAPGCRKTRRPVTLRELRAQPRDHRLAALACARDGGFSSTNMKPPPARAAAGEADHRVDRRVARARCRPPGAACRPSPSSRCSGRRAGRRCSWPGVLLREEALRHDDEQVDVQRRRPRAGSASPAPCWRAPSRGSLRSARSTQS